jgi:hypothetical protein
MLAPIIDDYNLRGGRIRYETGEIEATGLSLTYTFNTASIYDALKAVKDMAPNGFYYRVDLGTSLLEFKQASATPDFVFVKGRHINRLDLVLSIENVKNDYLFSGGDAGGGVNLFRQYQNQESIALYGVRLDRKSDNRVTVTTTADAIGESFIDERSEEDNQTTVTIMGTVMDITLLTPGKMIGFAGFGTFVDNLMLQIVRREYTPEAVTLSLGVLPPRLSPVVEQLMRGLLAEQTVANPTAPS